MQLVQSMQSGTPTLLALSVFIITHNEADRIARTIHALRDLTDDIVVVDSGSTDATVEICRTLGARVVHNPWTGYGEQKRFAEQQCRHDWMLNVDADEVATDDLIREISSLFSADQPPAGAYFIRIIDVMPGDTKPRLLAHAHRYVRLYHKSAGSFSVSSVHDVVQLNAGFVAGSLQGAMHHFSIRSISKQIEKYNRYTDALALDLQQRSKSFSSYRLFVEFPLAFFKAYLLRRYFLRGRYGYMAAMNYAFFRHLRVAKRLEQQLLDRTASRVVLQEPSYK